MTRPWRLPARVALAVLAIVAVAEALFGRADTGSFLGVPFWTGVPFGLLVNGAVIGLLYGLVGVGLVGSVVVGYAVEAFFLRRFSKKPRLIVTVATIGVSYLLTFLESKEPDLITDAVRRLAAADLER